MTNIDNTDSMLHHLLEFNKTAPVKYLDKWLPPKSLKAAIEKIEPAATNKRDGI